MDEFISEIDSIDVDLKLYPFEFYKLDSLTALLGYSDPTKVVESGLNIAFCNLVATLCDELSMFYGIQESVAAIKKSDDIQGFLYDLSAFLGELDCPHVLITCGPINERFDHSLKRTLLVDYLLSEMKAARLFAAVQLEKPCTNVVSDKVLTPFLSAALNAAGVSKPSGKFEPIDVIPQLHRASDCRMQLCVNPPRPLLKESLDQKWNSVEQIINTLAQDCRSRNLLLLKRIDVTINSFLWCDRVRKHEDTIRKHFDKQRALMAQITTPDSASLLAATSDLLRVEQASSTKRRMNTRSKVHPLAMAEPPQDRGGRTNEMRKAHVESFAQQVAQSDRGRRGGHRGGHGGGGRGQPNRGGPSQHRGGGGRGQHNSHESQVRREYESREGR